jgi:probable phosphoglycerate mutase
MIYVIRHGQTNFNEEGRLQGRIGMPLNINGLKQAEYLKREFNTMTFDYVFSSPQERAIQTAEIATGKPAIIDPRIDVFDLGEADGLKREEVKFHGGIPDSNFYKGVEEINGFIKRIFDFMGEIENEYSDREVNILLSGHRCTTGCIGAYFEGIPEDGNILRFSSNNGEYRVYNFRKAHTDRLEKIGK